MNLKRLLLFKMVIKSIRTRTASIYIPTDSNVYSKIVITDDGSVDYTVLDTYSGGESSNYLISNAILNRPVTDKLASFNFTISNDGGIFLNKFNGGEIVKFYADITDATTLIFTGTIDNVKYELGSNGFVIKIDGRDYPELIDKTITDIEASVTSDVSLAGIFYDYYPDITLTFWNGSAWAEATLNRVSGMEDTVTWSPSVPTFPTTLINTIYQHKKGWNVITDICKRAGLDCYIEHDGSKWVLRTFIDSSITNTGSNIAYGINLIKMSPFGAENTDIINRVITYGKTESDNILLLKTENDTDSQDDLWIKDRIINDSSLDTMSMVQGKADFELAQGLLNPNVGKLDSVCLPTLKPGDIINISIPYCGVHGNYKVYSFRHTLGNFCTTNVELSNRLKSTVDLFIPKLNPEEITSGLDNPNNMTDSYTVYFDTNSGSMTHSDTQESDGALRLVSSKTTGFAIANTITTDQNVSYCEFRRYENFETSLDSYQVSNTGGTTWETYNPDSDGIHTFDIASNKLAFKMTLNRTLAGDTSPAYQSISLLYR